MRPWFACLLILTLTLRGLLGSAMAVEMGSSHCGPAPAQHVAQTNAPVADGMHHAAMAADVHAAATDSASSPHSAHGMAANHADHEAASAAPDSAHCADQHEASCSACGICHSTAVVAPWLSPSPVPAALGLQVQHGNRFASAQPAPTIKPPIA